MSQRSKKRKERSEENRKKDKEKKNVEDENMEPKENVGGEESKDKENDEDNKERKKQNSEGEEDKQEEKTWGDESTILLYDLDKVSDNEVTRVNEMLDEDWEDGDATLMHLLKNQKHRGEQIFMSWEPGRRDQYYF